MKYLYTNDIKYILNKRKTILLILILIPILVLILNINSSESVSRIIAISTGSIEKQNYGVLEIIMFIFNISTFLFLAADLYIKDIAYQLDNIFLRMDKTKWIKQKNIIFIIVVFIIKILQYIPLIIIVSIFKNYPQEVIKLLLFDIIYILFMQYFFLFIYNLSLIYKIKYVLYIIYGICILLLPKDILTLSINQILLFLSALTLIVNIIVIIFKFNYKKILESI